MAYKAHNSWSRGIWGFPSSSDGKASACNAGDLVRSLGQEDPLEKEMAAHCSILAWRIPWTVAYQAPGSSPWDCKESDTTEPLHFTSLHFTSLHFTSLHFRGTWRSTVADRAQNSFAHRQVLSRSELYT